MPEVLPQLVLVECPQSSQAGEQIDLTLPLCQRSELSMHIVSILIDTSATQRI